MIRKVKILSIFSTTTLKSLFRNRSTRTRSFLSSTC